MSYDTLVCTYCGLPVPHGYPVHEHCAQRAAMEQREAALQRAPKNRAERRRLEYLRKRNAK